MNIVPASQNSFTAAIRLLESCGLPTQDLNSGHQLFVIEEGIKVIGTVTVEYDYTHALLRSLAVAEEYRNKDIGKKLVEFIEAYVQQQGVETIYLLTNTASKFFLGRGYKTIDRSAVPGFIKNTTEYSFIGCASAVLMKKEL